MKRNGKLLSGRLWKLLLPSMLSAIAIQMGNVVDQMLIGSILGEKALASIQLLMPIILAAQLPGMLFGIGSVIVIGGLLGERKLDQANKTITTIVLNNAFISIVLVALILIFRVPLLNALTGTNGAEFWANANGYLLWFLPSILLINVIYPIVLLFTIDNHANLASIYMVMSNVVNLIFDYVLLRFTSLGTGAAALSSLIGYISCAWVFVVYAKSKQRLLKPDFSLGSFAQIRARIGAAAKMGQSSLATNVTNILMNFGMNMIIVYFVGSSAIVAYTLCNNIILLTCLFTGGIGQMIPNVVSVLQGEKDYYGIQYVMKQILKLCGTFLAVWTLILLAVPSVFTSLYGITEPATRSVAMMAARIFAISLPFYIWNDFMASYYQSIRKAGLSVLSAFLENVIFLLPLAFVLARLFGIAGAISAVVASQMLAALTIALIRKKKYPDLQGYLLLPAKKELPNMEASTDNSEANLMRISDALTFFGNLHDLTDRECYYLGLTVEEMVTNTLRFPDNAEKKLTIDISATIAPDELLIRIRDDGVIFNPWEGATEQADAGEPIVLPAELVRHIASETMYLRMLNMNNTIVSFKRNKGGKQ